MNFQMFKLDLAKAEEPEIKLPISTGSSKQQESFRKISTSALLTTPNPLCGSQQTGKFFKNGNTTDGNTRPPYLPPAKSVCRSRSNSWNRTWNNGLVQTWERSRSRMYIVTLPISAICRVHHTKCWAGWSVSWNQDCWEKYQ